jgi:serine/threonine protein kinase
MRSSLRCDQLTKCVAEERAASFVGSPGYISPELLLSSSCGKRFVYMSLRSFVCVLIWCSADFWAIGCIIYHMVAGVQPFKALTSYLSMEKTKKAEYTIPPGFDPVARDLVANFLIVDPTQRLGDAARGGPEPIRTHEFFESVDWSHIWDLDPPPLEAGLVKKEPPPQRRHRSRSKDPVIMADDSSNDNSDVSDDGSARGETWAAVVRDLSEDEMEDGRSLSYSRRRSDAYRLGGGPQGTLGDRGSGRQEDRNRNGAQSKRMIFPGRDESVSGERSERTVRGGGWNESNSPLRNGPSTQTSPERGHSHETTGTSISSQAGGEVRVWDAHYGGQPTSLSRDSENRLSLSQEINESRVNGGSPVSSEATSSTAQSEGQAVWYAPEIACIFACCMIAEPWHF